MSKELISPGLISDKSIFGAYSQKENRVTAALLHLIEIGGEPLLNTLFKNIPDSSIHVRTQVSSEDENKKKSIYDGIISCGFSFNFIIESKVTKKAVRQPQLQNYIKLAKKENATLIYITPDTQRPSLLKDVEWYNWETIADCLKSYEDENILLQPVLCQFLFEDRVQRSAWQYH